MTGAIFEGLVGQTRVKDTLVRAVEDENLPQTLVFAGPKGVGKSTCAKLLAKHLHKNSDGKADTFVFSEILAEAREQKEKSPFMVATRRMINFLARSPLASKMKVAILDWDDKITDNAQNALLKTLEEPREDTMLIVTVSDETILLPTILSRARVIKFGPLSEADIKAVVPDVSDEILQMAQGSLGWAKAMQSDETLWQDVKEMIGFWAKVRVKDTVEKFAWVAKKQAREDALQFLRVGVLVLREDMIKTPKAQIALDILNIQKATKQIEDNVNVRLALEAMLLTL